MQDVFDRSPGLVDQLLGGCALNREKANQMFRRWKGNDTLYTLVICPRCAIKQCLVSEFIVNRGHEFLGEETDINSSSWSW